MSWWRSNGYVIVFGCGAWAGGIGVLTVQITIDLTILFLKVYF